MEKQIVKNLTMLTLVVGLCLVAAVKSANAQASGHTVTADIPFDFIVGDKTLPSGRYTVSSATNDGQGLKIMNRAGKAAAFRLSNPVSAKNDNLQPRMVFHRYGEQYFLAQVWSGDSSGRQVTQSKRERNLRQELAANSSKSKSAKVVEVAAR